MYLYKYRMIKIIKEDYNKKLVIDISFSEEKKKESNMVMKEMKIYHKMESKSCFSIELCNKKFFLIIVTKS